LTNAADSGQLQMMALLIAAGADVDWSSPGVSFGFPLRQAIYWYHVHAATLLLDAGADVNMPDKKGETPLHYAVAIESEWIDVGAIPPTVELTAVLLAHGADVSARNARGETAADVAARWRHTLAEQLLRQLE
jgi:ankyrin repeat protein